MRKAFLALLTVLTVGALIFVGCAAPAPAPTSEPIKLGVILPLTGNAAGEGPAIERGIKFVLDEAGWEFAGRAIKMTIEDETDNPDNAVAKAKKLVEQDKVDVIIGPLQTQNALPIGGYLKPLGIPHLSGSLSPAVVSDFPFFFEGSARGNSYVGGLFTYDDLGARTAAVIHQDFYYGEEVSNGFTDGFTSKGGTITSVQKVPFGPPEMAPYIQGMGQPDAVMLLLVSPFDVAFMRQYHEFGLKMPVIFGQKFPQGEAWKLDQIGDAILGMYGVSYYSPLVDTPANKQFVDEFEKNYGTWPGDTSMVGYLQTIVYLTALKATGGDTNHEKIIKAIDAIKKLEVPCGTVSFQNRLLVTDEYVFKAVKIGDKINWQVVKKYPSVQPR